MRQRTKAIAVAGGFAAFAFAGCGGDDGGSSTTAQSPPPAAAGGSALKIEMSEFKFVPKNPTASAGKVNVTAPNVGNVEHELVLFKTDRDPGSFKVSGGRVDEEALEKASDVKEIGEIADVEPGDTKSGSFKLTPGKYVMICNVSGHYQAGMYGSVTVR